jgi:hypothetical protein
VSELPRRARTFGVSGPNTWKRLLLSGAARSNASEMESVQSCAKA